VQLLGDLASLLTETEPAEFDAKIGGEAAKILILGVVWAIHV
jgi:hypothetical protein